MTFRISRFCFPSVVPVVEIPCPVPASGRHVVSSRLIASTLLLGVLACSNAYAEINTRANFRIGVDFVDDNVSDSDYRLADFGSVISIDGATDLSGTTKAVGRVQLGDRDSGTRRGLAGPDLTTEVWAGLAGAWGSLRAGHQYGSFYDLINTSVDRATWGSCWFEFECTRKERVLKYDFAGGPLRYAFSAAMTPDDTGAVVFDQLETGIQYRSDTGVMGLAYAQYRGEDGQADGNTMGAVLAVNTGQTQFALTYQSVDQELAVTSGQFPDASDDVRQITLYAGFGTSYLIYHQSDIGTREPSYLTAGVVQNIGPAAALIYEFQQADSDTGGDEARYGRVVFNYTMQ